MRTMRTMCARGLWVSEANLHMGAPARALVRTGRRRAHRARAAAARPALRVWNSMQTHSAPTAVGAKKRRISLQPLASAPASASTEAPIPRTQLQLGEEFDKCVDALIVAVDAWREVSHAQIIHADLEDVDAIIVGGRQLRRAVEAYQERAKADQDAAAAAEAQRRKDLVPVRLDPTADQALYRKYRAQLADGNSKLYRCPLANPATGECNVVAGATSHPGKKATIAKHIARNHIQSERTRKTRQGYGLGVAEGWIA